MCKDEKRNLDDDYVDSDSGSIGNNDDDGINTGSDGYDNDDHNM